MMKHFQKNFPFFDEKEKEKKKKKLRQLQSFLRTQTPKISKLSLNVFNIYKAKYDHS